MIKVGDRVSVVVRRLNGERLVTRAIVRENSVKPELRHDYVCVRVTRKNKLSLADYPTALRLDQRGISWAQGWNSREADALRVAVAL